MSRSRGDVGCFRISGHYARGMGPNERWEDDEESPPDLIRPEDFLPREPFPDDARRLGLDRYSGGDAAWIALAANLDGTKSAHRLIALVLLVMFLIPVAATVLFLFR